MSNMVSKNVEIVLKTLKGNPNLRKDLDTALRKILDTAKVDLSDEETSELFRTLTEAIIIVDPEKDIVIIETKSMPKTGYEKDMEKAREEGTLGFEMWLRHVKNFSGKTVFQMNCNPNPVLDHKLRKEHEKWMAKKRG